MKKLSFDDFKILFLAKEINFEMVRYDEGDIDRDEYIATIKDVIKDINDSNDINGIMRYLDERGHDTIDAYEYILSIFVEMEHKNYK